MAAPLNMQVSVQEKVHNAQILQTDQKLRKETAHSGIVMKVADISKLYISGHAPDHEIANPPLGKAAAFVTRQRDLLLKVNDRTKRNAACDIVASSSMIARQRAMTDPAQTVFDDDTCRNLEVLAGERENMAEGIATQLTSFATTETGKVYLMHLMTMPTTDTKVLDRRQTIIKALTEEWQTFNTLERIFEGVNSAEEQLLSFWDPKLQLPGCVNSQYFQYHKLIDARLNSSVKALDASACYTMAQRVATATTQCAACVVLPLYGVSQVLNLEAVSGFLKSTGERFTASTTPLNTLLDFTNNKMVAVTNTVLAATIIGFKVKTTVDWSLADTQAEALVQNKLVHISHVYRKMLALYNFLSQSPLKSLLNEFPQLEACLHNQKLKPLFEVLSSRTFNREAKWFFRRGPVLAAWYLLTQMEKVGGKKEYTLIKEFQKGLAALAEVDAFLAISKFYRTQNAKNKSNVCFPSYDKTSTSPKLVMEEFWHPSLKTPVKNTMALGQKHGVITGPNAAGKSTLLKCSSLIVMAQTLGIATAKSMQLTPFQFVGTSMNTMGSLAKGESGFVGQVARVKTLMDNLKSPGFHFLALDELYTQTTAKEGSSLSVATLQTIAKQQKRSLMMIVSHDPAVAELASRDTAFTNYTFDQQTKHHLIPGTSTQHIALDVAKAKGLSPEVLSLAAQLGTATH
jgi:hypothetical protein